MPPAPLDGSHRSATENSMTSNSPSQKFGTLMPISANDHRTLIHHRVLPYRGDQAERDSCQVRKRKRGAAEDQRIRHRLADQRRDLLARLDGTAEIAVQRGPEIDAVRHYDRLIEPECLRRQHTLFLRRVRTNHQLRRIDGNRRASRRTPQTR